MRAELCRSHRHASPRFVVLCVGCGSSSSTPPDSAAFTDTYPDEILRNATGTTNVCYTIAFNAASSGQHLTISWTDLNDFGGFPFAALLEATLQAN